MKKVFLCFIYCWLLTCLPSVIYAQNQFLDFEGIDDQVNIPSTPALRPATTLTLEAWVRVESSGSIQQVIAHRENGGGDDGYVLRVMDNLQVQFAAANSPTGTQTIRSAGLVTVGTWHHLAGSYDGSTVRVYIDGVETSSPATGGPIQYEETNFVDLGIRGRTGGFLLDGQMDEVRIWNVVRTPGEIQATKDVLLSGNEPGLVAYYNFEQGVCGGNNMALPAPEVLDQANGNHGTLNGFSKNGCESNFVCDSSPCGLPSNGIQLVQPVPAASTWGLILLALTLLAIAAAKLRQRAFRPLKA